MEMKEKVNAERGLLQQTTLAGAPDQESRQLELPWELKIGGSFYLFSYVLNLQSICFQGFLCNPGDINIREREVNVILWYIKWLQDLKGLKHPLYTEGLTGKIVRVGSAGEQSVN